MSNSWGRPPRNEVWQDLQALAIWLFVIGIIGYLLFPSFFKDVYTRLTVPVVETTAAGDSTSTGDSAYESPASGQEYPELPEYTELYNSLYTGKDEVSAGYWVIFVADGQFNQLGISLETYNFLMRIIENDRNSVVKNTVIFAANGQIQKNIVSDEVYAIISSLATIDGRKNEGSAGGA